MPINVLQLTLYKSFGTAMKKKIYKIDNFKIVDVLVSNIKLIQSFYNISLKRNENAELNYEIGLPFLLLMENNNCLGFSSLIVDDNSNISYQIMLSENILRRKSNYYSENPVNIIFLVCNLIYFITRHI